MPDTVDTVLWAPDDGWRYHPKHVEQFADIIIDTWMRSLSWDVTQRTVVIPYRRFGTTYPSRNVDNYRYSWTWLDESSHPVTITPGSSNCLINARYCRYSVRSSWWWMELPPETRRAVCRYNYWHMDEISLLRYYAAYSGNSVPTFRDYLSVPKRR